MSSYRTSHPPVRPSIHPSIRPSVRLSVHPFIHPSVYISIYLYIYTSIYVSTYLSIFLIKGAISSIYLETFRASRPLFALGLLLPTIKGLCLQNRILFPCLTTL